MPTAETADRPMILLTGGSGYIGGRLIPVLEGRGARLRCMARNPDALRARVHETTEVVRGDVLDPASLDRALEGVDTVYYLVHLMSGSKDFERDDRQAASNLAAAARKSQVRRIIYLGGLGDDADPRLSPHLRSRHEVGEILRESGAETIEFRASMVIGAGSLSFDMMRSLTDRLPVMLCPRWLTTPTQPIAVDDVLSYLLAALELAPGKSRIFEIGGTDVSTYGDLIREYARQQGLRRWLISVPVLTPYLSSLWLALVTPASFEIGRHLIEGLKNPTAVQDRTSLDVFPIRPAGVREAHPAGDHRGPRIALSSTLDDMTGNSGGRAHVVLRRPVEPGRARPLAGEREHRAIGVSGRRLSLRCQGDPPLRDRGVHRTLWDARGRAEVRRDQGLRSKPGAAMHYESVAIPEEEVPQAADPLFRHLVTTYAGETNKTAGMWRAIPEDLLEFRPHEKTNTIRAILVHQILSERRFFAQFVGTEEPAVEGLLPPGKSPAVPAYLDRYVGLAKLRLPQLASATAEWWLEERPFFGGLKRQRIWTFWRRVLHTCHHRTQVQTWLRLAGRHVPAIYGPSGDVTWDEADPTYSVEAADRGA